MNPNAKEFVPAHLMRKRQDEETESKRVGELAEKLDGINMDKEHRNPTNENGDSLKSNVQEERDSSKISSSNEQQRQLRGSGDENERLTQSQDQDKSSLSKSYNRPSDGSDHQTSNSSNQYHNNHRYTNGETNDLERGDDDRFLLKAGENYCEFNGEEFIVPGDDDEQEGEISNPGYDFGNAEDNENEEVANAFEEFLSDLPQ